MRIFVSELFIDRNFKNSKKEKAGNTFADNGNVATSNGGDSKMTATTLSPKTIQHRISKDASAQIC